MVLKSLISLLVLLLLSSQALDLQAALTPDPDDDILATEDNEYLPVVTDHRLRAAPADELPVYCRLNAGASGPLPIVAHDTLFTHCQPFLSFFADPLCVLMSFQC
jgi:hypothetical protein